MDRAIGSRESATIAMILVPLPRLVLPTWGPFFCIYESRVDEGPVEIYFALLLKVLGKAQKNLFQDSRLHPVLVSTLTSLIGRVPFRQVLPSGTSFQNP